MIPEATDRLLAPYRPVRQVTAPADGPWSGTLVRTPAGASGVLVEASGLGDAWDGWDAAADGHVAAPLDLVRTSEGHQVLLPLCVERLDAFLHRRRDAGVPIGRGEAVTIGVSLVRAISELGPRARDVHGEWWLTEDRRPMIATDVGDQVATTSTLAVVRELAADVPDAHWHAVEDLMTRDAITGRDVARAEDRLFEVAAAEPLADAPLSPRRTVVGSMTGLEPRRVRDMGADDTEVDGRGGWMDQLSRHVDADLADAVSRATTGVWRRLRDARGRRRAPWLVAAAVGGVVLAGGLLWPGSGSQPVAADPGAPRPVATDGDTAGAESAQPTGSAPPAMEGAETPTPDAALDAIVDQLLIARTACDGEPDCLADVIVPGAGAFPPGIIDADAASRTVSIVDEFGGVAVLRADDASGALPSQLIVVQQEGRRWLLRDVYAAQQP